MDKKGFSIRSLAKLAGVSVATVSRALRGFNSVKPETRDQILKIATECGYREDPRLSRLFSVMREKRSASYVETLAFLVDNPKLLHTRVPWMWGFYSGALAQARIMGFELETVKLPADPQGQGQVCRILAARGIRGLLFPPVTLWEPAQVKFEWDRFSAVEIGHSLFFDGREPNRVESDVSQGGIFLAALDRLKSMGYRRIGLAVQKIDERLRRWGLLATYLLFQDMNPNAPALTTMEKQWEWSKAGFESWLKAQQPDVVVTNSEAVGGWLKSLRIKVPENLGVMRIDCSASKRDSGLRIDYEGMGKAAVVQLSHQLANERMGLPERSLVIHLQPIWQNGLNLRKTTKPK